MSIKKIIERSVLPALAGVSGCAALADITSPEIASMTTLAAVGGGLAYAAKKPQFEAHAGPVGWLTAGALAAAFVSAAVPTIPRSPAEPLARYQTQYGAESYPLQKRD